jgi:hypothetical protein
MDKPFLTAAWKNLIMANYVVDRSLLEEYLPRYTVLDEYQGRIYVSLIGFMFADTRLRSIPVPFHRNFEEVNLRFYVKYNHQGTWKRGAVFIKEIVPKAAISFVANTFYHEHYQTMRMKHYYNENNDSIKLGYHWKNNGIWNKLEAITEKEALPMLPGSEEEFIAEHYWGYAKYNEQTTFEYGVQHPAWKVHTVKEYLVSCDFEKLYGDRFAFLQDTKPSSVFMAKGSEVAVLPKRKL